MNNNNNTNRSETMTESTYVQGTTTVQAIIPTMTPTSIGRIKYCMANGNEIVAEGELTADEYAMLTDPDKGRSEATIAEHIYDWIN